MSRVPEAFSQRERQEMADESARQIEILQTVMTPLLLATGIFATVAFLVLPGGKQSTLIALAMAGGLGLLLTDIVLPGANGVAIARELTERLGLNIPVLYMTGFTENGIVHRGVLDPGHRLLQKPFAEDQLLRKLREALDA